MGVKGIFEDIVCEFELRRCDVATSIMFDLGSLEDDENSRTLLELDIESLKSPISCMYTNEDYLIQRKNIIERHMGSMALTRGKLGDKLREVGALNALLTLLHGIVTNEEDDLMDKKEILELVITALGALRDLACGNSLNRLSIGNFTIMKSCGDDSTSDDTGIGIISYFIERYHGKSYNEVLRLPNTVGEKMFNNSDDGSEEPTERGRLELKVLTSALGVVRNITHSTKLNCDLLHQFGMTKLFIWRLREGEKNENCVIQNATMSSSRLPDASKPWREASFRIASSLINMAEKCNEVAQLCADCDDLIYLLLETWGGLSIFGAKSPKKGYPVLHLGLIAILKLRLDKVSVSGNEPLENLINILFERESVRKKAAQARELQRKVKK